MQEIDDFFDLLDADIEVIWGISTDDSLGEDAKVTILATGMEDGLGNDEDRKTSEDRNDKYYEQLIPTLYKPVKEAVTQIKKSPEEPEETKEEELQEEEAVSQVKETVIQEQETPTEETPHENEKTDNIERKEEPETMLNKWKKWLEKRVGDYLMEPDEQ